MNDSRTGVVNQGKPVTGRARRSVRAAAQGRARHSVRAVFGQDQLPDTRYGVLVLVVIFSAVCSILVGLGRIETAAVVMWGLIGLMALWFIFRGRLDQLGCLLIGVAPIINLLRGALYYSGVPLVFAGVVFLWPVIDYRKVGDAMRRYPLAFVFLGMACIYYGASFLLTGQVRTNLRFFELACAAVLVVMMSDQPRLIEQTLLGLVISAILVGMGDYPHMGSFSDMRLGQVRGEEGELGNPFALGAPLALGVLVIVLDRGRWIGLTHKLWWRLGLLLPTLILLTLSASRAGWLVVAGGLAIGIYSASRQRLSLLSWAAIIAIGGFLFWHTPLARPFQRGWERTFGEERSLSQSSGSRSDQWIMFYHALTDNGDRFLFGYGPGEDFAVQAEFSSRFLNIELPIGVEMVFHALVMHVGIEYGFLGLAPLLVWLLVVGWKCYRGCRTSGLFLPLACFVAYLLAGTTVTTFDTVCGTFLGTALLSTSRSINPWSPRTPTD
jgi:O-antigen ligase